MNLKHKSKNLKHEAEEEKKNKQIAQKLSYGNKPRSWGGGEVGGGSLSVGRQPSSVAGNVLLWNSGFEVDATAIKA